MEQQQQSSYTTALIPTWTLNDDSSGLILAADRDGDEKQAASPASPSITTNAPRTLNTHRSSSALIGSNDTSSQRSAQTFAGLPKVDYRQYSPPLFQLSQDCTTLSSRTTHLATNAKDLAAFMRSQALVPPKPQVHVKGTRRTTVDFDIRVNLMGLLVPEDPRQRIDYVRCVGDDDLALRGGQKPALIPRVGDGGLEEWCRLFVEDAADVKSFELTRTVVNLDMLWIEGQLRSLISSTGYKGNLSISFPVTHARVVVRSADKVNKYVSSMKTMFKPKAKYEVVQAMWPFASAKFGVEGRHCVVQSEEGWWKEWRDPIKYAVATRRRGWVTNEDKLEALMEGKGRGVQPIDWDTEAD